MRPTSEPGPSFLFSIPMTSQCANTVLDLNGSRAHGVGILKMDRERGTVHGRYSMSVLRVVLAEAEQRTPRLKPHPPAVRQASVRSPQDMLRKAHTVCLIVGHFLPTRAFLQFSPPGRTCTHRVGNATLVPGSLWLHQCVTKETVFF